MNITFKGSPVTLEGPKLNAGDKMPEFTAIANDMSAVALADTSGKRIFVAVPSVDTPVCDTEVRTFNQKAAELPGVHIWVISMDLPFAQQRWCAAAGIDAVQTISDFKDKNFGMATGTYIKELGLLARAIFVTDEQGTITYAEYVPEIGDQPDYEAVYAAVKAI